MGFWNDVASVTTGGLSDLGQGWNKVYNAQSGAAGLFVSPAATVAAAARDTTGKGWREKEQAANDAREIAKADAADAAYRAKKHSDDLIAANAAYKAANPTGAGGTTVGTISSGNNDYARAAGAVKNGNTTNTPEAKAAAAASAKFLEARAKQLAALGYNPDGTKITTTPAPAPAPAPVTDPTPTPAPAPTPEPSKVTAPAPTPQVQVTAPDLSKVNQVSDQQQQLIKALQDQIAGKTPSVAEQQLQLGLSQELAAANAARASARGISAGLANRNALNAQTSAQSTTNQAAGQLRAGEVATATNNLNSLLSNTGSLNLGATNTTVDVGKTNAGLTQQTNLQTSDQTFKASVENAKNDLSLIQSKAENQIKQQGLDQAAADAVRKDATTRYLGDLQIKYQNDALAQGKSLADADRESREKVAVLAAAAGLSAGLISSLGNSKVGVSGSSGTGGSFKVTSDGKVVETDAAGNTTVLYDQNAPTNTDSSGKTPLDYNSNDYTSSNGGDSTNGNDGSNPNDDSNTNGGDGINSDARVKEDIKSVKTPELKEFLDAITSSKDNETAARQRAATAASVLDARMRSGMTTKAAQKTIGFADLFAPPAAGQDVVQQAPVVRQTPVTAPPPDPEFLRQLRIKAAAIVAPLGTQIDRSVVAPVPQSWKAGSVPNGTVGFDRSKLQPGDLDAIPSWAPQAKATQPTPRSTEDMLSKLDPKSFKYISPEYGTDTGAGVLAQDLEKSKIGRTLVKENENGVKQLDPRKGFGAVLAAQADLNRRLAALEGKQS
jgi:hypothetical protein